MKTERGFTLVEVVATVGLTSLAMLALAGALHYALTLNTYSKDRLIAINDARRVSEQVRTTADTVGLTGTGSVSDANIQWQNWISNTLPNETVQVQSAGTDPLQVTVSVNWLEKARNETIRLVTLVTKR